MESLFPGKVKVNVTTDDIWLRTNLTIGGHILALKFNIKSFFCTILGFPYSLSGLLGWPPEGVFWKIPESDKSGKPIKASGIDKVHLKRDGISGCIANGVRDLFC